MTDPTALVTIPRDQYARLVAVARAAYVWQATEPAPYPDGWRAAGETLLYRETRWSCPDCRASVLVGSLNLTSTCGCPGREWRAVVRVETRDG